MKENMIKQYGEEEGEKIYYANIRKMAMEEIDKRRAPAEGARKNKEALDTGFMNLTRMIEKQRTSW